jgi:hypothetical protein
MRIITLRTKGATVRPFLCTVCVRVDFEKYQLFKEQLYDKLKTAT